MKEYPEVPPNCKFFMVGQLEELAFIFEPMSGLFEQKLSNPWTAWRPIIAAVAEVEWRLISEKHKNVYWKIFNKYMTDVGLSKDEGLDMYNAEVAMRRTKEIALEWRKWGKSDD